MNFRERGVKLAFIKEAIICIAFGTGIGLVVYGIFLYFHIAIFGWNLGLIFAPIAAGYAETQLANKLIGQDIGAISAFILFIHTTFYSFILKNPTLGVNIITFGSIALILQAAFPTLVNYILLVGGLGLVSYFLGIFTRITKFFSRNLKKIYYRVIRNLPYEVEEEEPITIFDEQESNKRINEADFYFITSTDVTTKKLTNLGQFQATVILEKDKKTAHLDKKTAGILTLNKLKEGKDECLLKLIKTVESVGGNGVIDLEIDYGLIGMGGDSYQITTMGMGVYIT